MNKFIKLLMACPTRLTILHTVALLIKLQSPTTYRKVPVAKKRNTNIPAELQAGCGSSLSDAPT